MIAPLAATVVLGSSAFAPAGYGCGTAHPHAIHDGGDPNGGVYESSAPWGHHPIVRLACTRGSANFTGWLVRPSL
jgi:hypothetical protein